MNQLRSVSGMSTALIIGCLIVLAFSTNVDAQYRKRVIIHSGQAAPGTNGAVFSTESWQVPTPIGISQSGRVLFHSRLDEGVGDATSENSQGLWATDADTVILVARVGGAVPGQPGMLFLKSEALGAGGDNVYMDADGQIGLWAEYSSTGERIDETHGFFAEENGILDLKVWMGMELLPDMPGITITSFGPIAFNAGKFLFGARIDGPGITSNRNDLVICEYDSGGILVIAQIREPMPIVGNEFINVSIANSQTPLDALGGAIINIKGGRFAYHSVFAVYYWTPESSFVPIAISNQDSTRIYNGNSRMNSVGGLLSAGYSWVDGSYKNNIWTGPPQLTGGSRVVTMGDVAPGTGGATFANYRDYVLFDNNQIAFNAGLSDNGWGIWMGDASGLRKVAQIGDSVPGVPPGYQFTRVNWMVANRAGRVAFRDFVVDSTGWGYDGIWLGDADGLEAVSLEDDQIEIAPGVMRTIVGHYIGHTWWTRTGADGYATQLNDADELAFGVSFLDGSTALLFGSRGKALKVVDVDDDLIADKQFILSRVTNNTPEFTETFIDTVTTDSVGLIDISKYYKGHPGGTLMAGDSISLRKVLHTVLSVKHSLLLGSAYRVVLDNAQFSPVGSMSYSELDLSGEQEIKMDHTTLEFSLVVSIEWDADLEYIESLEEGFRRMSNYLYDVSDGQMRLDTIAIYDKKENWGFADIQIYASNMIWPHVDAIGGIYRQFGSASDPVEMPRKWFGGDDSQRYGTFDEYPLDMSVALSYRTFAHEFGHFGLSLKDEYRFTEGERRCADRIHAGPYGFMDCQYVNCDEYSSELSSEQSYSSASCRNTFHWNLYQQSTWETVESLFEETYEEIPAPIVRPSERELLSGYDYMPGPNLRYTGTYLVHYDVGALVEFPITHTAPEARDLMIRFIHQTLPGSETDLKIDVILLDTTSTGTTGNIKQGLTAKDGGMRIAGMLPGHVIAAAGYYQEIGGSLKRGVNGGRTWLYTGASEEFADSIVIGLKEVQGNKAVISRVQLLNAGFTYQLDAPTPFLNAPSIEHQPDGGVPSTQIFASDAGGYNVAIPDNLAAAGTFQISAVDDSGAVYHFIADYTTLPMTGGIVAEIKGPGGVSDATLDNRDNSLENTLLLSTDYLVLRAGLNSSAIQAGPAQNLAVFPELGLTGENSITIRYSDDDLSGGGGDLSLEESLRIFHWSTIAQEWEQVGGGVDTSYNEVTASITKVGTYAAFTTDTPTDVEDHDPSALPQKFGVSQNYPNPFNPSTVISYSLPTRSDVNITVYNVLGRRVRTLFDGHKPAGRYSVTWDGRDDTGTLASSGVYFYRITTDGFAQSKKMMLLK